MNSTPSAPKSVEQFRAEISSAVQSAAVNFLIDGLAAANVRIAELSAELEKLKKDATA